MGHVLILWVPGLFLYFYISFNLKLDFARCCLHPATGKTKTQSASHPEYEGHVHHYVITITSLHKPQLAGY